MRRVVLELDSCLGELEWVGRRSLYSARYRPCNEGHRGRCLFRCVLWHTVQRSQPGVVAASEVSCCGVLTITSAHVCKRGCSLIPADEI